MSGHSKWAQIKRQKGVTDSKRGQIFTKLSNAIIITVVQSGGVGDPEQNFKLRLLMEKAKSINMPKENIERAIERGMGKGGRGESLQEVVYEGFGPGGVGLIIEAATDNKQRTTPLVKNVFEKYGGALATPGAVAYQFQTKGMIRVKKSRKTMDEIFLIAVDAGADDMEEEGEEVVIYTSFDQFAKTRKELEVQGLEIVESEVTRKPTTTVSIAEKGVVQKLLFLTEKLEELDEVQEVFTNFDSTDKTLASF